MHMRCYLLLVLLPFTPGLAGTSTGTGAMPDPRLEEAVALMNGFAARTGLTSGQSPQRYLWTDAFAVCNYLGLTQVTGEEQYTGLALQLIDQVHHTLGRHRDDDRRTGWISGLDETDGERHPTRGGLRIGKPLPERAPDEPRDERLEWERDGQYFHYLTRWMHALDQAARTTRQPRYSVWAHELARSAHDAFVYPAVPGQRRMAWKMSIDLKRVLVPSMGQHDPLDGYITALQLRTTAAALPVPPSAPDLGDVTRAYAAMMSDSEWATPDPLGLGGLLVDAWRVQQLIRQGERPEAQLLERLLGSADLGLQHYVRGDELHLPARYRLAFRELGLAIGLHALERLQRDIEQETPPASAPLRARVQALLRYLPLRDAIESFWRAPANRQAGTWTEHRDINEVMLATSLVPDGFLRLASPSGEDQSPAP